MRSKAEDIGRGQTRQAPVGFVKEFSLYAKGIEGAPARFYAESRADLCVFSQKIHLAALGIEGPGILASRETSEELATVVKAVGPGGQSWREVGGSVSEAEQTKLDRKMGDGVWVVNQRRDTPPTSPVHSGGRWLNWP